MMDLTVEILLHKILSRCYLDDDFYPTGDNSQRRLYIQGLSITDKEAELVRRFKEKGTWE